MTSRSRCLVWLVAVVLASGHTVALAQDTPLYRDPSPTEGPRIMGPLLPARPSLPSSTVAPTSGLGPFEAAAPADHEPIIYREPLLGITPMPPPLPAMVVQTRPGGDVSIKRTTTIRGPKGVPGQIHEWFRDVCFGSPRPSTTPKRGFFATYHSNQPEADASARSFNWPTWPAWPLLPGR